jgi:hypothetical protein
MLLNIPLKYIKTYNTRGSYNFSNKKECLTELIIPTGETIYVGKLELYINESKKRVTSAYVLSNTRISDSFNVNLIIILNIFQLNMFILNVTI